MSTNFNPTNGFKSAETTKIPNVRTKTITTKRKRKLDENKKELLNIGKKQKLLEKDIAKDEIYFWTIENKELLKNFIKKNEFISS